MPEVTKENVIPDVAKEAAELKSNTKKDRNNIENVLKKADDQMKAKKQELYFEKLNAELGEKDVGKKISSYDDLTVEQRRELDAFQIPDAEVEKMVDATATEIQDITTQRNDKINSFENKIQQLYDEAQKNVERINKELQNPDLKEEEKSDLQEELGKWQDLMEQIGPEKESQSPIRKELTSAIKNHDEARMNGVRGMTMIYPKEKVYDNDKVKKIIPKNQREAMAKEEAEKEKSEKENPAQEGKEKNGAAKSGNAPKAAENGQTAVTPQEAEIGAEEALQPDFLTMLGYNPDNVMNFENSSAILEKFADGFTDKARLEMLNDPATKKVLLDALKITGKNLNPRKSRLFNDTRDRILRLAKGPMMEMALRDLNIENPENVKKEFNNAVKVYNNQRSGLERQLEDASLSDEQKDAIAQQIEDLDNKYQSIRNVADFQKASGKIKTIRTRIISFKEAILSKDTYSQTVKAIGEGVSSKVRGDEKSQADNEFMSNMRSKTNSIEEQEKASVEREQQEREAKETKAKEVDSQQR